MAWQPQPPQPRFRYGKYSGQAHYQALEHQRVVGWLVGSTDSDKGQGLDSGAVHDWNISNNGTGTV